MDINFEYDNISASERLEAYAIQKLKALGKRYGFIVAADIYFKTESTDDPEKGKICGIRLNVPKTSLFSESSEKEFELAASHAFTALERQLERYKEKLKS